MNLTINDIILKYKDVVNYFSSYYAIPKERIFAHIIAESYGDPLAIGDTNLPYGQRSIGLMQIRQVALDDFNKVYGKKYTLNDLTTPSINIEVGTGYLKILLSRYKNLDSASKAYNAGSKIDSIKANEYLTKIKMYEKIVKEKL